jgi:ethanolamine transporter EutH
MFSAFKNLEVCFNSTAGCGWRELAPFINGILKNLVVIGLLAAACMISYAGFILLQGLGDANARSRARSIFINVVIGLIILYGAYFIVDLILTKMFVNPSFREFI